jgi:arginase
MIAMNGKAPGKIALLGVPVDLGASVRGTLMGPAALRTAGLGAVLEELGYDVTDHGDLLERDLAWTDDIPPANTRHYREVQAWTRATALKSYEMARSGAVPVFLGGDHSLSMGSVLGVARHWQQHGRGVSVLWFDAHADYNTPQTTESQNMHGMSAAFLCGEAGLESLIPDVTRPPLQPDALHLFGVRSIDREEKQVIRNRGINVVDMRRIDRFGVEEAIQKILETVKARNHLLHLSFDLDVLDPEAAPGVGTIVPGGVTYREAHLVMEMLYDSGLVASVDVVELNPFLDDRGRTARAAVELIGSLFGQQITERPTPTNAIVSPED